MKIVATLFAVNNFWSAGILPACGRDARAPIQGWAVPTDQEAGMNVRYRKRPILLLLISILLIAPALSYAGVVGSFSRVEGRVDMLKVGADAAAPVKTGDSVSMGDIVRTKSDGKAEIAFKDDTVLRLAPETRMKIDEYTFNPDNSRNKGILSLLRGKLRAVVKLAEGIIPVAATGATTFSIQTPTTVAGVRGTDFMVFYEKGITGVVFSKGHGFVYNLNITERMVNISAGQATFVLRPDVAPQPPRPATGAEVIRHLKDTNPDEKTEEKEDAPETLTGGEAISEYTALAVIMETLTAGTLIPGTGMTNLRPVTETPTSPVTVNVVFPE